MPRQVCRPAPPVHYLILATHDEAKSCYHVTPASPRSIYGNSQQITGKEMAAVISSQFHSLLALYMVMVERPLGKRLSKCPVSQFGSVYSLNQPSCRTSLVADTRRVGVRIQVITQRKHHRSSPWMKRCHRLGFCVQMRLLFVPGCSR